MNILCLWQRTEDPEFAWELVKTFLAAEFSQADRHLRHLGKIAMLEEGIKASPSAVVMRC